MSVEISQPTIAHILNKDGGKQLNDAACSYNLFKRGKKVKVKFKVISNQFNPLS